ncbi:MULTISPECIES: helix-turn-helix domain-containing protein [Ralstonia]|jgi:transcriptional regulator with XRE-family HTH domain|uniref:HTH cro/C1-type domain-containing protein n=1 Tax=Ralstonia pickettii OR214 TaxID=1264675 RepID=R0CSR7_RALPI|nr:MULTISPECIES: helix-turn-helix domain-containing protein [Ralstonia]ENZ79596.1 hypothetical protein OR214_00012 [Ralstonia pickettii OR214]MBL4778425.1 helix-turn-helix domain-containing protein [Ralstonia sp.]MCM3582132.1 helix-turn-helix domain-containing protein [Ralstonia pickettii]
MTTPTFLEAKAALDQLIALKLSQPEIARRSGVSQPTLSHLATGRRGKRTSFDVTKRLNDLLSEVRQAA